VRPSSLMGGFMKVLVAVDITDPICDQVIDQALPWVQRMSATVDLVYVIEYADVHPYIRDPQMRDLVAKEWQKIGQAENERLVQLLNRFPQELRGEIQIRRGRTAQVMVELSSEVDAVLLGTHGRTGLERMWMGSVAEAVTRRAKCPVLVLRLTEGAQILPF